MSGSAEDCSCNGGARPKVKVASSLTVNNSNGNSSNKDSVKALENVDDMEYGRNGLKTEHLDEKLNSERTKCHDNGDSVLRTNGLSNAQHFSDFNVSSTVEIPNLRPMRADLPKSFFSSPDVSIEGAYLDTKVNEEEADEEKDDIDDRKDGDHNESNDEDDSVRKDVGTHEILESDKLSVNAQQASSYEDPVLPRVINWGNIANKSSLTDVTSNISSNCHRLLNIRPSDLATATIAAKKTANVVTTKSSLAWLSAAASLSSGQASVPAVTPCHEDSLTMVRSISLNGDLHQDESRKETVHDRKKNSEPNAFNRCRRHLYGRVHRRTLIWSHLEASRLGLNRNLTPSSCGVTAVINVLKALKIDVDADKVNEVLRVRRRRSLEASLFSYLWSRHHAGTTHLDLIDAIDSLSCGRVEARFFATYPKRSFKITKWLIRWLEKGVVPVVTINPQMAEEDADAWHHQMIYGASVVVEPDVNGSDANEEHRLTTDCDKDSDGSEDENEEESSVYATNPFQELSPSYLHSVLCSDSVLRVRIEDLVHRDISDLQLLKKASEGGRWDELNVLGQVVNALRIHNEIITADSNELNDTNGIVRRNAGFVSIPAVYKAGVTLFVRTDSPWLNSVRHASQLKMKEET